MDEWVSSFPSNKPKMQEQPLYCVGHTAGMQMFQQSSLESPIHVKSKAGPPCEQHHCRGNPFPAAVCCDAAEPESHRSVVGTQGSTELECNADMMRLDGIVCADK